MAPTNIVLIVADTLRKKNVSSDDSTKTPFLSSKTAVERYYSNSPWTAPAHATIFSGDLPSEHGTTTQNTYFDSQNALVNIFKQNGYETLGLSENSLVSRDVGFGEEFNYFGRSKIFQPDADTWNYVMQNDSQFSGRKEKYLWFAKEVVKNKDLYSVKSALDYFISKNSLEEYSPTGSRITIRKALDFLEREGEKFVFLNLMPTHAPYTFEKSQKNRFLSDLPEEKMEKYIQFDTLSEYLETEEKPDDLFEVREKAYDASIAYLDSLLEEMYSEAPEDTVFVVVGDHGELLGEYNLLGTDLVNHHFGTFKELVQVPMMVYSKNSEFEINVGEGLYDHRSLHNFLIDLSKGKNPEMSSRNLVRVEYFGKEGFNKQFGWDTPEDFEELFKRKSFSLIDDEYKYDVTSDGNYLWSVETEIEEENLRKDKLPETLADKGEILYNWRID